MRNGVAIAAATTSNPTARLGAACRQSYAAESSWVPFAVTANWAWRGEATVSSVMSAT